MNVLQIVPDLNAGGVERTTLEVAEALVDQGFTPHICSQGGRLERDFIELGAKLHKFDIGSKNPLRLRTNTKKLIDIIKSENIDVVHARSRAPAWPAHAAAKATNRPFLTTYHGIYNASSKIKRRYNAIMARGALIIANSDYTKRHILKEHGTDPDIIRVIPRGVDMKLFDPAIISQESVKNLRLEWNVKPDEKLILLPGRLTRWKGQITAIEALEKLDPSYKLVLLGDPQGRDAYVEELKALSQKLGVAEQVIMPGHFTQMPEALYASDIVIAPSTEPEAFGRVVTEAQAMGRPVIASAHGGPMETIIQNKTGEVFEPGNSDALSHIIQDVMAQKAYDSKFSRAHIAASFSKKQLQDKTLAVYAEILR